MNATKTTETTKKISSHKNDTLLIGLDWGTNTSCLITSYQGNDNLQSKELIPTVVGYAKEGLLEGILPGDAPVLFGKDAIKHHMHLREVRPMKLGVIEDKVAAKDFALHLRERVNRLEKKETRAVIGVPARADMTARENIRDVVTGVFNKVILIPEPFLAALGFRDESKVGKSDYIDPVRNSLFIDIGGGSTDLCIIQGYYPQAEDQISIPFAGDAIDDALAHGLQQAYPDHGLSMNKIRELKEKYAYTGDHKEDITVELSISGKLRRLEIGEQIGNACNQLLEKIFASTKELINKADSDTIPELIKNIIITGGGSSIQNLAPQLEKRLLNEGYDSPRVCLAGEQYQEFVARGALKASRQAQERQWQNLIG